MRQSVTNIDVTLRDGGYRNGFNFSRDYALRHSVLSVESGFDWVEIAYRNGSFNPSTSRGMTGCGTNEYIEAVAAEIGANHVGIILHPKNISAADLAESYSAGARLVRICLPESDPALGLRYVAMAKELGFTVCVNLTRISQLTTHKLTELAVLATGAGSDALYLADSNGSLRPKDVGKLVTIIREVAGTVVGVHAHNNLGLALSNSIAAVDNGATWVDSAVLGMGKGAGNLIAEQWLAYLENQLETDHRLNVGAALELADFLQSSVAEATPSISPTDLVMGHFDLSLDQRRHITGTTRERFDHGRELTRVAS